MADVGEKVHLHLSEVFLAAHFVLSEEGTLFAQFAAQHYFVEHKEASCGNSYIDEYGERVHPGAWKDVDGEEAYFGFPFTGAVSHFHQELVGSGIEIGVACASNVAGKVPIEVDAIEAIGIFEVLRGIIANTDEVEAQHVLAVAESDFTCAGYVLRENGVVAGEGVDRDAAIHHAQVGEEHRRGMNSRRSVSRRYFGDAMISAEENVAVDGALRFFVELVAAGVVGREIGCDFERFAVDAVNAIAAAEPVVAFVVFLDSEDVVAEETFFAVDVAQRTIDRGVNHEAVAIGAYEDFIGRRRRFLEIDDVGKEAREPGVEGVRAKSAGVDSVEVVAKYRDEHFFVRKRDDTCDISHFAACGLDFVE